MKTIDKLPRPLLIYLARELGYKTFVNGHLTGVSENTTNWELADFISRSI